MEPVRTCVGCRQRSTNLLRIVSQNGTLVPDLGGNLPGRGARLHPNSKCLRLAIERKAFGRAFRTQSVLEVGAVTQYVEQAEKMLAE